MKKRFLTVVILVLFCLTGCASAEERAFEEAGALMEDGDYEAAIEAFSEIGMYRKISRKIGEAQALLEEENTEFLYGEWADMHTGTVYIFSEGGRGSLSTEAGDYTFLYTSDGKTVEITVPMELWLMVDKEDGIPHLKDADGNFDLVPKNHYESQFSMEVEITMDNWQEYFVARRAQDVGVDEDGYVNHRETGYSFFLKEEYRSRLDLSCDASVCFEIVFTYTPYIVEGRLDSDDYTLIPTEMPGGEDAFQDTLEASLYVLYRGWQDWRGPQSDFNNAFCAFIGDGMYYIDGVPYLFAIEDAEVLDVHGTLILNP
jgi:hypothetical protein